MDGGGVIAAPVLTREDLYQVALDFEDAHATLAGMQHEVFTLGDEVASCKYSLETEKAKLLAQGVDSKNTEQREACLRLQLCEQYQELHEAEHKLSQARLELELAKLAWDALRYRLKAYEVATRL